MTRTVAVSSTASVATGFDLKAGPEHLRRDLQNDGKPMPAELFSKLEQRPALGLHTGGASLSPGGIAVSELSR